MGCAAAPAGAVQRPTDGTLLLQSVSTSGVPLQTLLIEPDGTVRRAVAGGALVRFATLTREQTDELLGRASAVFDGGSTDDEASTAAPAGEQRVAEEAVRVQRRAGGTIRERWLSEESMQLWVRALELARIPSPHHAR